LRNLRPCFNNLQPPDIKNLGVTMKINFLLLILLLCAITVNSQTSESKQFLDVLNTLRTPDNQLIKCDYKNDEIQKRILFEYGAVYVSKGAILPKTCRFESDEEVSGFASQFTNSENKLSFGEFYLQPTAKKSLENVFKTLGGYGNVARICSRRSRRNGIPCEKTTSRPKLNDDWSLRTYTETALNWHLNLTADKSSQNQSIIDSFANNGVRPKMTRVAIPGGSQHHLGLAIDVNDSEAKLCNTNCQATLEKNGWYRTVPFDSYHFTFLGYLEFELPSRGLKQVKCGSFKYWIPDVSIQDYPGFSFIKDNCPDI
jgi:D-alanyl-D-alanine carboxypeptidase